MTSNNKESTVYKDHEVEYAAIKKDVIRVLILNSIIFIAIIAIYYTDKQSNYLQNIYQSIF